MSAHGSGLGGAVEYFGVEGLQLPIALGEHVRDIATQHLAQRGLRDAGALGDLLLGQAALNEIGDEVLCFHGDIPSRLLCQSFRNMQERLNGQMARPSKTAPSELGIRLKKARKERGLGQVELANAAGLGQSDVSKLELGTSQKTTAVVALSRALRVPPNWLEFGEGPEPLWHTTDGVNAPAAPPPKFEDRRQVDDSDWATLTAVKALIPEAELVEMRARYAAMRQQVAEEIAATARGVHTGAPGGQMVRSPHAKKKPDEGTGS